MDFIIQADKDISLFINSLHTPAIDYIMFLISAKYTWVPLYLFILYKTFIKINNLKNFFLFLFTIAILISLSDQISVHLFKNVFMRLRPCHCPEIKNAVHIVNNHCGGKYGFISSHSTNAFALFVFLSKFFNNKKTSTFFISIAGLIAISRVFLGVHYLGDVLAGAITGSIIALIVFKFIYKPLEKNLQISQNLH